MKLVLSVMLAFTANAFATPFGDSYQQVTAAQCTGADGDIQMNLNTQVLTGQITGDGRFLVLDFERLKGESPDYQVSLIRDFLSSGYDLLGGQVVSKDETSFGTYAIVLDKMLTNPASQDMYVIYVEAMTGWQITTTMTCSFQL